jgi:hypothetical protein
MSLYTKKEVRSDSQVERERNRKIKVLRGAAPQELKHAPDVVDNQRKTECQNREERGEKYEWGGLGGAGIFSGV